MIVAEGLHEDAYHEPRREAVLRLLAPRATFVSPVHSRELPTLDKVEIGREEYRVLERNVGRLAQINCRNTERVSAG